ncbi:MAG: polymer-forming cytoskeletal protein [Sphingomonadaceae bacterium]
MFGSTPKFSAPGGSGGGSGALSFIGSEVTITGNIGGGGNLHIDGRVDGDVACSTLILGRSGQVNGNVTAEDAKIAGTVNGTVAAKALSIEASARINGDLSYDAVSVESGAQVEGRVKRLTRSDSGAALKLIASE